MAVIEFMSAKCIHHYGDNKQMKLRLDKYLADMGCGTRSEVKADIKKGYVTVGGVTAKSPEIKIDTDIDRVTYKGDAVGYIEKEYYMLNKPAGVVSATEDARNQTVVDLITSKRRKDLFPVGRLDKDTEGLLIITNDGDLAHRLLTPNKHVGKVYYAEIKGIVTQEDVSSFKRGLLVEEGFLAKPANLKILGVDQALGNSEIELEIFEGKYHQVKRMFEAVGKEVTYLKRLSMGLVKLDETLKTGEYRTLTTKELEELNGHA